MHLNRDSHRRLIMDSFRPSVEVQQSSVLTWNLYYQIWKTAWKGGVMRVNHSLNIRLIWAVAHKNPLHSSPSSQFVCREKIELYWCTVCWKVLRHTQTQAHNHKCVPADLHLLLCFYVDGVRWLPDVIQLHCPGQDGPVALSSRVDRHRLHLHQRHWEDERGTADPSSGYTIHAQLYWTHK